MSRGFECSGAVDARKSVVNWGCSPRVASMESGFTRALYMEGFVRHGREGHAGHKISDASDPYIPVGSTESIEVGLIQPGGDRMAANQY